jgi:cytochrome c oxidase subunit 5a
MFVLRTAPLARRAIFPATRISTALGKEIVKHNSFSFYSPTYLTLLARRAYSARHEETYEEFNARYTAVFESVEDLFELQRNLNNCFAYDLTPSVETVAAALRACRRVDDFATAVRVLEAVKEKTNAQQYAAYLEALKPVKEELSIPTKEELGL